MLTQYAVNGWCSPEPDRRFQVVQPQLSRLPRRLHNPWFHANAFTNPQVLHFGTNVNDDPRCLVTEHHRTVNDVGPDAAKPAVMHVTAADPYGDRPDAHITGPKSLLDVDVTLDNGKISFQY